MSRLNPPLTAASDRGPSPYFHGRETILRNFKNLLDRAHTSKTETTFLIQGASGAGKSALLYECEKMAKATDWKVSIIAPTALYDGDALVDCLQYTPVTLPSSIVCNDRAKDSKVWQRIVRYMGTAP